MLPSIRPARCLGFLVALTMSAATHAEGGAADRLQAYSLEQLMSVRLDVTSAARKPQPIEDTAAAIHVITREDIRRSGLSTLPEVLRLAPGLQVARIDGGTWAISSRGFNAKNSDNLLVMMDGRTLHTPTFTGVYWNAQDVVLEDVERIEVIRGPGGALWGANAVTGVINIITRTAGATQGGLVKLGAGTNERQGTLRHGGKIGDNGHYRVYVRGFGESALERAFGIAADDRRHLGSAGFRADWSLAQGNSLTLQGDTYRGESRHTGTQLALPTATRTTVGYPIDLSGGNLMARWTHAVSAAEQWSLQIYHDRYVRNYFNLGERRQTTDLDFQHHLPLGQRQDIVWGLGYRVTHDAMDNTAIVSYAPARRTETTINVFAQDEIALLQDRLYLIAGAKVEHNDYTGIELQPNLRLRWKIDPTQTAWVAASRAVHTPSRTDADGLVVATVVQAGPTTLVTRLQGWAGVKAETVDSYEAGWRFHRDERFSLDVSAFRAFHRDMMTIERGTPYNEGTYRIQPLLFFNRAHASTRGLEWNADWRPNDRWHFRLSQSLLKMSIARESGSSDTSIETESGRSPRHQLQFHAAYTPNQALEFSTALYRVARLPALDIPAYSRLDARIAWRPYRDLELALVGRDLFGPDHAEFVNPSGPRTTEIPRSFLLSSTWRF